MPQVKEYKAGTEAAAWFHRRFSDQIVSDIRKYVNAFGRLRSEAETMMDADEEDLDPDVHDWYEDTPSNLTHAYEVLAPEAAYPNTQVHFVIVVTIGEQYWRVGFYSSMLGPDGTLPANWGQYQWQPRMQSKLPWPTVHKPGESEAVLPTPENTTLDEATGFLQTFVNSVSKASDQFYGGVYQEMFPGGGQEPGPSMQQPQSRGMSFRSLTDEQSSRKKSGQNSLVSGKSARRKQTRNNISDALRGTKERLRGDSSGGSGSFNRPPDRGGKRSRAYTDDKLFNVIDSGRFTPYPSWFNDLELYNESGDLYDKVIYSVCVPVLRRLMSQKNVREIESKRFWHYVEMILIQDGYLDPTCTYEGGRYTGRMNLDQDGYCTCTDCGVNPRYGEEDDIFKGLAKQDDETGRCKRQAAQLDDDFERRARRNA